MLKHVYRISLALLFALSLFSFGQEDTAVDDAADNAAEEGEQSQADLWKPDVMQDGRFIQIGEYTIENPYKQRSSRLLHGDRRLQVWRYFMHGVTDLRGYPVPWQAIDIMPPTVLLDPNTIISLPYKKSNLLPVALEGGKSATFPKSLIAPEMLYASRGDYIRVFVWIKGEDTGREADLYTGCPGFTLSMIDGTGTEVATASPMFKTRGTFPWFCYHIDVKVPYSFAQAKTEEKKEEAESAESTEENAAENSETEENAENQNETNAEEAAIRALAEQFIGIKEEKEDAEAVKRLPGLYITLCNPTSGTAWFSTLSWQRIKADETIFSPSAKITALDPMMGSYAPNPDYDELPMHLFFGVPSEGKWTFLTGTKALKPLIDTDNLNECLEIAKSDWMYMLHAVPYLFSLHANGILLKTMPDFESGWAETVLDFISSSQQPSTGLWGVNDAPNLFITDAILKNTFSAQVPPYHDWTPHATPWRGSPKLKLAYADNIIDALVDAQTLRNRRPAAWNNCAFSPVLHDAPQNASICDLPATAAATSILRYAAASASEEKVAKAQMAISQAWNTVMSSMLMRNGLWKTSFSGDFNASQASLFDFLDATPWLSFRTSEAIPPAQANLALDDTFTLTASWKPEAPAVALRIFVADNDVKTEELNETHLAAIIQPPAKSYSAKDPVVLLRELVDTGAKRWGISPVANGNAYIAHKLASIPKGLKVFTKLNNQKLKLKQGKRKQLIHFATVNAYGEMSEIVTIPESLPPSDDAEEGTEENN
ncbi:MAG: hypothetical protein IKP00_05965 [Victivallales bacterium]|nr:hypothetical protein [Victivallales bacterium]